VPFLAITNGLQLLAAEIVHTDQKINRLEQLPLWH